jgi:TPP-dependent 2-oxoacid decarboxylase
MSTRVAVGNYLLSRLAELGVEHLFGVPGDYNLAFLDQIVEHEGLTWVGTCNELNAAYASDGYARLRGLGVLVTTFGVGELSAINGIAGAYAEFAPVVCIVGLPSTLVQENKILVHHSLGNGEFTIFSDMFQKITAAHTILTENNAGAEIDRVLTSCRLNKRPVYIGLPSNVAHQLIEPPIASLTIAYPPSNQAAIKDIASRVKTMIETATSPVVLIDIGAQTHRMKPLIEGFLKQTGLPFATMLMGKGLIDESHPQFIGVYCGDFSWEGVQHRIEQSDCVICFGILLSDFNSGGFTSNINSNAIIVIHGDNVMINQSRYDKVIFSEVILAITEALTHYHYPEPVETQNELHLSFEQAPLKQDRLWTLLSQALPKNPIILAETGTSAFGSSKMRLPDNSTYIAQNLWASIGYTVGAVLGVCLAYPAREVVLFVGDGSFQISAQELSTLEREGLTPTVFLLDNDGYTVERIIHGPNMPYNDIQHWDYALFAKAFGCTKVWSTVVETEHELKKALEERKKFPTFLAFIVLKLGRLDAPEELLEMTKMFAQRNKYEG